MRYDLEPMKNYVLHIAPPDKVVSLLDKMKADFEAGCLIRQEEELDDDDLFLINQLKLAFKDMIYWWD